MNKRKRILGLMMAVSLAIGVGLSFLTEQQTIGLLSLPFAPLAAGLRRLSLLGGGWNVLAWALYAALSLAPAVWLLVRLLKKRARGEDALLALLSALTFWALYWMINPSLAGELFGKLAGVSPALLGVCLWATLLCYGILRLCTALGQTGDQGMHRWLKGLIWAVIAACLLDLYAIQLPALMGSIIGGDPFDVSLLFRWVTDGMAIRAALYALTLTDRLEQGWYTPDSAAAAGTLAEVCGETITVTALIQLVTTLLQVLVSSAADKLELNLTLDLPVFQLLFLLCLLLFARMIARGKVLQEDSDSII